MPRLSEELSVASKCSGLDDALDLELFGEEHSDLISFVGSEHLLRGIPSSILLQGFGKIFSNNKGTEATYQLSSPVHRIGYFISHNWAVHRVFKFLALAFKFNMPIALATCASTLLLCSILGMIGILPVVETVDGRSISIVCRCTCVPLTFCALFLGSSIRDCFWHAPTTAFLDKACIHQVDTKLQQLGIRKLGAFLRKSDRMLVLYSSVYLRKLWTIYEVASFLSLHDISDLEVVPIILPCVHLLVLSGSMFMQFISIVLWHVELPGGVSSWLPIKLDFIGGLIYLVGMRVWSRAKDDIQNALSQFDVANSRCSVESDRAVVYANIVALMKMSKQVERNASEEEALEAFNQEVRVDLSAQFHKLFDRYAFSYMDYLVLALSIWAPYHADCWAELGAGRPFREVLAARSADLFWNLFAIQVWHVVQEVIMRQFIYIRGWKEWVYVLFANVLIYGASSGVQRLVAELTERAATDDGILVGLLVAQVISVAASIFFLPPVVSLHRANTGRPPTTKRFSSMMSLESFGLYDSSRLSQGSQPSRVSESTGAVPTATKTTTTMTTSITASKGMDDQSTCAGTCTDGLGRSTRLSTLGTESDFVCDGLTEWHDYLTTVL